MDFGFTLKPDNDLVRTVELTKRAEANGFTYGWIFDSHVIWREPYVALTLMAQATTGMRLGTCVTNPATREPSVTASTLAVLDELSGGRMDLVNKYPREQLPEALTGYIGEREGYDYHHHAEVGSGNAAFVGDEVTDRFCVLGEPAEHVAKLQELADAGVDQFNFYLMNGDEEEQLDVYGREVVPVLGGVVGSA